MKAPRFPCEKCRRGTTKKNLELDGMCRGCREIWTREPYATALARIPQSAEETVRTAILERPTLDLARATVKKTLGSIRESAGREWDIALLIMVDERRRARRHQKIKELGHLSQELGGYVPPKGRVGMPGPGRVRR